MEAGGGREIPIRSADGQRANAWKRGDRACPTYRRVPWKSRRTGPHLQTFQQQDCFAGDSIMTMTYPFPVSADEFEGKRALVTGGTKCMGQAMVRRFTLSVPSVATTQPPPLPDGPAALSLLQTYNHTSI